MKLFHRLAGFTLFLTVCLVTLGGFVHNTGSSLACPDWPLCFGQVMPKMEGPVAIEHSHRLLASLVGILSIALVVISYKLRNTHVKLFKFSCIALGVVIFQGVLGGVTVLLRLSPLVSTAHLATSQAFAGILLYLFFLSSNYQHPKSNVNVLESRKILRGLLWAAATVYIQMCLGAFIRHGGQTYACGLGPSSAWLCMDGINSGPVFWPDTIEAKVHMLHRFFAIFTLVAVVMGTRPLLHYARRTRQSRYRILIISGHILVSLQIALGILTIATEISIPIVTAHLAIGMLLWLTTLTQNYYAFAELKVAQSASVREAVAH